MKIRSGFVSNSSSSSFICDISGRCSSGMDISLSDCDMFRCTNGHTVDKEYYIETSDDDVDSTAILASILEKAQGQSFEEALTEFKAVLHPTYRYDRKDQAKKDLQALIGQNASEGFDSALESFRETLEDVDNDESDYETDPKHCPICQMTHIRQEDLLKYLILKSGKTHSELVAQIRDEYLNFESFENDIKGVAGVHGIYND